jgi:manganese/zinc/iron transport system ATP- binding protein
MNESIIQRAALPALEVHDLTVSYQRRPVLWNIDLALPEGVMTGIIGPNGSGKTTLLKAILGLLPVDSGWAHCFGKPLNDVRSRVAYVPQRSAVEWDFPASVLDVALMGRYGKLGLFRRPSRADRDIARHSLDQVGMLPYASRQIAQLSGGQQQRVFLARALAQQADLYVLDEPFTGVDAATEATIIGLLRELVAQGKTVVCVHHDLRTAADYFGWVVLLNQRVVAAGPTADVYTTSLLQEAYGGALTLLDDVAQLFRQGDMPRREPTAAR